MNTTFEKSANSTDEWYTPKEIIDALGEFDLDPCAPVAPPIKRQMSCTTKMTMDKTGMERSRLVEPTLFPSSYRMFR